MPKTSNVRLDNEIIKSRQFQFVTFENHQQLKLYYKHVMEMFAAQRKNISKLNNNKSSLYSFLVLFS